MKTTAWWAALCLAGAWAPTAFAEDPVATCTGSECALAARPVQVPESLPVQRADALRMAVPSAGAEAEPILVGGPCATPCAKPCPTAAPKPCGVCREGYDDCGNPRWGFQIWIGFWLWGQDGTVGTQLGDIDIDTSLSDAWDIAQDHLETAFTGGFRVTRGRCNLHGAVSYLHLEADANLPTGEPVEVEIKALTAELVAGYRVFETALGCGPCSPCLSIEPYVGARLNSVELDIARRQGGFDDKKEWVDPIVGCEFRFDFRNRWWARVAADVGGFGLGSDVTWGARGEIGYMFSRHVGAFLGFAAIAWDYEDGTFRYDLTQYGPYAGIVFAF